MCRLIGLIFVFALINVDSKINIIRLNLKKIKIWIFNIIISKLKNIGKNFLKTLKTMMLSC